MKQKPSSKHSMMGLGYTFAKYSDYSDEQKRKKEFVRARDCRKQLRVEVRSVLSAENRTWPSRGVCCSVEQKERQYHGGELHLCQYGLACGNHDRRDGQYLFMKGGEENARSYEENMDGQFAR